MTLGSALHRPLSFGRRGIRALTGRAYGWLLGWRGAFVPVGSRVIGGRRIQVGRGFEAFGPVWIEAVERFAGHHFSPSICIGKNFSASKNLHISAAYRIDIGDDCLFGSNVYVGDNGHGAYGKSLPGMSPDVPPKERALAGSPVLVGHRVWLGDNVVVLAGVTIGDGAVVGANTVVREDVPPGVIAVGSPVRFVKKWDAPTQSWLRVEG